MNFSSIVSRVVASLLLASSSLSHAAELSGRITAADGVTPLAGIEVQARFTDFEWIGTNTDSNGDYSFSNLAAATYRIRIEDNTLNTYLSEWHENAADYSSATPFVLGAADVVSGVNASLTEGGRLTGNITADNGGAPLPGIRVTAFRFVTGPSGSNWQLVKSRSSLSDGSYNLGGLENGSYRLRFSDDSGNYAPEHHDNEIEFDDAATITIASAGTVANNVSLAIASRIQGTVIEQGSSTPLQGIEIYAFRADGANNWYFVNSTTTQPDGTYNLGGLTSGTYRLQFYSLSGLHQTEYHDNVISFSSATNISLGSSATLTGYDASLAAAGRIEGTITDGSGTGIPNIDVNVFRWNTVDSYWESAGYGYTDSAGNYIAGGLPSGTYRVGSNDPSNTYEEKYHANATTVESADDVLVTAGSTSSGIDIMLEEFIFGSISGSVANTSGNPLADIQVSLFRYNATNQKWDEVNFTTTNVTGGYRHDNIGTGTYRLRFVDPTGSYAGEYHIDAYTVEGALDVAVTEDNETVVNAVLADAASISGTVTQGGSAPVSGIWVNLYRQNTGTGNRDYLFSRITEADGTYAFQGLPTGTFFVEFADYSSSATYAREYYNGEPTFEGADPLVLVTGQDETGIDASLELSGQITGTITSDTGGNPLLSISVTAYRLNEVTGNWNYAGNSSTNASGIYTIQGLVPGQHRLQFYDPSGGYLEEFHNNKATLQLGDNIAIASGASATIDASLATASRIEGTVTAEGSGIPLPDILVEAYRVLPGSTFQYMFSDRTDQSGNYSLGGLVAGTYRVQFSDSNGYYLFEAYDNANSLSMGTDITVAATSTSAGINAALTPGGRISGRITDAINSVGLDEIGVYFYRNDGASWQYQGYADTDTTGNYISPALPSGAYRIEFYDFGLQYRTEFYDNRINFSDAASVAVALLQTTGFINAALSPVAQSNVIAGTITDATTSSPLAGIHATAYKLDTTSGRYEFFTEVVSDGNGEYAIENLPAGLFRVGFMDRTNGTYAQQFSASSSTLTFAQEFSLGTSAYVDGIDASMEQAMTISGSVRNESGDNIGGVSVIVRRWEQINNAWFSVNTTQTLANGSYTIGGLADGTYRIEFLPTAGSGYYGEFYDDARTIHDASDLYLFSSGGNQTGIDAELSTTPPAPLPPAMTGFRQTGPGSYVADFQGQPGTLYQLERSPTMLPLSWIPVGAPFTAQAAGDLLVMTSSEPKMFWRVREN